MTALPASMRLSPGAAGMIVSFRAGSKAAKKSAAQKERGKGKELLRERSPERNTSLAARKNVSHERRLKRRANLQALRSVSDSSSQMRVLPMSLIEQPGSSSVTDRIRLRLK